MEWVLEVFVGFERCLYYILIALGNTCGYLFGGCNMVPGV